MTAKLRLARRYLLFAIGLYFLSWGIVLIVKSTLGTTPISSVNYVLSLNTPLTLGTCTFLINMLLIVGQFLVLGRRCTKRDAVEILLQIPFSFLFSAFIDANMLLVRDVVPTSYVMSLALLALGIVVQAIGVVLEIKPRVAMMSAEAFVKYSSSRANKNFGHMKVVFDVTLISIAILLSLGFTGSIRGVREGSLIAACVTGLVVNFMNIHIFTRHNYNAVRRYCSKLRHLKSLKQRI